MIANKKIVQTTLILVGLSLIILTYVLYPMFKKNKLKEKIAQNKEIEVVSEKSDLFESVEYKGLYDFENQFTVKSESAQIFNNDPDVVHMKNMRVVLYMKSGQTIIITSDKGTYNKVTYDCFFEDNVKATNNETTILAKNLDLLASEDSIFLYNNVVLTNENGSLKADKVEYDIEAKQYLISMFDNEKIKLEVIQ